jgi:predicted dehydrogenase
VIPYSLKNKNRIYNMKTFNWGIIGPGSIARDFVDDLKYVKSSQRVVAVLSHREESAREFSSEYSIGGCYTDIDAFLRHPEIDAVYIATPHTAHFEQTLACLENKIPVLCEKPLVLNAIQAKSLIDSSKRNNTFLLEGMWIRFLPSIGQVLNIIKSNSIGKIISVKASMSYKAPADEDNRYFNPELGGGSLLDLGVYPVFLSQLILGKPEEIKAIGKRSEKGIDETCAVLCRYQGGKHAILESSIITQTELSAEIAGDKGVIKIMSPWNEKPEFIRVTLYDGSVKTYSCDWEGRGFQYEVEEVITCVNNKAIQSDLYDHHFSLHIMETMDEIRKQLNVKYESFE